MPKSPEEALKTEFSADFVKMMQNRMVASYYMYGPVGLNFGEGDASAYDAIVTRLAEYADTRNTEFLIDAANYAMIEFMYPSLPGAHFRATDSDESPGPAPRRKDGQKRS